MNNEIARAVHQPRKHVAAEIVGAERMVGQRDAIAHACEGRVGEPAALLRVGRADHERGFDDEQGVALRLGAVGVDATTEYQ